MADFNINGTIGQEPIAPIPDDSGQPQVMTQGISFPLRTVSGGPKAGTAPMVYQGEWEQKTYAEGDVVVDGAWTMTALTETNERAGVVPIGDSEYFYSGTLSPFENTGSSILFGNRYTVSGPGGYLTGYRVDTVQGNEYAVYFVNNQLENPAITKVLSFTALLSGWKEFSISPILFATGAEFDLVCVVSEAPDTPVFFNAPYVYNTPSSNNPSTPIAGEIVQANVSSNILQVNHTDNDSVDQTSNLLAIGPGDNITGAIEWTVTNAPHGFLDYGSSNSNVIEFFTATSGIAGSSGMGSMTVDAGNSYDPVLGVNMSAATAANVWGSSFLKPLSLENVGYTLQFEVQSGFLDTISAAPGSIGLEGMQKATASDSNFTFSSGDRENFSTGSSSTVLDAGGFKSNTSAPFSDDFVRVAVSYDLANLTKTIYFNEFKMFVTDLESVPDDLLNSICLGGFPSLSIDQPNFYFRNVQLVRGPIVEPKPRNVIYIGDSNGGFGDYQQIANPADPNNVPAIVGGITSEPENTDLRYQQTVMANVHAEINRTGASVSNKINNWWIGGAGVVYWNSESYFPESSEVPGKDLNTRIDLLIASGVTSADSVILNLTGNDVVYLSAFNNDIPAGYAATFGSAYQAGLDRIIDELGPKQVIIVGTSRIYLTYNPNTVTPLGDDTSQVIDIVSALDAEIQSLDGYRGVCSYVETYDSSLRKYFDADMLGIHWGEEGTLWISNLIASNINTTGSFTLESDYTNFEVYPPIQAGADILSTWRFDTIVPTPIEIGREVDGWLGNANVDGLFSNGGSYENVVPDDNAYGVDIKLQEAQVPDDWGFVAYSDGAVGGGAGVASPSTDDVLGWGNYTDSETSPATQVITTTPQKLSIDGASATSNTDYLPGEILGSGQLWDAVNNKIIPIGLGDGYTLRIDLEVIAETSNPNELIFQLDISGNATPDIPIVERIASGGKTTPYTLSVGFPIFALGTFIANGGQIFLSTDTGSFEVASRNISIHRISKGA